VTTPAAPIQSARGAHHVSPTVEGVGALVRPLQGAAILAILLVGNR